MYSWKRSINFLSKKQKCQKTFLIKGLSDCCVINKIIVYFTQEKECKIVITAKLLKFICMIAQKYHIFFVQNVTKVTELFLIKLYTVITLREEQGE